jgi:hypothetical protein
MMLDMAMMMVSRVSGLRERHKAGDGDHKGHGLHAELLRICTRCFVFFRQQNKGLAEREQGEAKQTKRLIGSRRGRSHTSNEDFFIFENCMTTICLMKENAPLSPAFLTRNAAIYRCLFVCYLLDNRRTKVVKSDLAVLRRWLGFTAFALGTLRQGAWC